MPYIGKCECQQCGRECDAHENRTGLAYYNCGPCGVRVQQRTQRGNALFLKGVRVEREPEPVKSSDVPPVSVPEKPVKRGIFGGTMFEANR